MLKEYIQNKRKEKDILLMTHIVLGYPSFEDSLRVVEAMVAAGVDLIELQIPFSEPIADGPMILRTNQRALDRGSTVAKCFDCAKEMSARFSIPFLFMSYYNILFKYGPDKFAADMATAGLQGAIVPDIPPEEGEEYLAAMKAHGMTPVFLYTPTTPDARLRYIAGFADGFVYCVARKGVTGAQTDFSTDLDAYLARCRAATDLPLALGFGVKDKNDVDFLRGKVDIAVIGTATLNVIDTQGVEAVGPFLRQILS